jgi:putative transposase
MPSDRDPVRPSGEVPDAVWPRMEPLIPAKKGHTGHPRTVDLRGITAGSFSVLRTGIQWQACPRERFGPPSTIYYYFAQWVKAGVFARLWVEALAIDDDLKGLEWTWQRVDGAMPQAPVGGRPRAPIPRTVARKGPNAACEPRVGGFHWPSSWRGPIATT